VVILSSAQLATLRTVRRCLAVSLARVHQASRHLRISPQFGVGETGVQGPLVEEVDGSTAWDVALAADVITKVRESPGEPEEWETAWCEGTAV